MQDILHFMREYFPSQIYEQVLASILADVDEHPMPQQDSIAFLQFLLAEWKDMTVAGQKNCCRIIELLWSRDACKLSAYSIEHLSQAYNIMAAYDRRKTAEEMMQAALYQLNKPEEAMKLIADFWKMCLHNKDDIRDYAADMFTALHRKFPAEKKAALVELLSEDPRPAYQRSADRIYGIRFAGFEIKFKVEGENLTVVAILPLQA
jgi:hypothetical protein